MRVFAVETYLALLEQDTLPDILLQIVSWVLGEFGHMSSSCDIGEIVSKLVSCMDRVVQHPETKSWVLSALMKLLAHQPQLVGQIQGLINRYQSSMMVDLQQRAHEFTELVKTPALMKAVLPQCVHSEDIEVDELLSHLDGRDSLLRCLAFGSCLWHLVIESNCCLWLLAFA